MKTTPTQCAAGENSSKPLSRVPMPPVDTVVIVWQIASKDVMPEAA